jgi:hypothetical protein
MTTDPQPTCYQCGCALMGDRDGYDWSCWQTVGDATPQAEHSDGCLRRFSVSRSCSCIQRPAPVDEVATRVGKP